MVGTAPKGQQITRRSFLRGMGRACFACGVLSSPLARAVNAVSADHPQPIIVELAAAKTELAQRLNYDTSAKLWPEFANAQSMSLESLLINKNNERNSAAIEVMEYAHKNRIRYNEDVKSFDAFLNETHADPETENYIKNIRQMHKIVGSMDSIYAKAYAINVFYNMTIPYDDEKDMRFKETLDLRQNYQNAPQQTITGRKGICTDQANIKCLSLVRCGIPKENVFMLALGANHAIVGIDAPDGTLALNNLPQYSKRSLNNEFQKKNVMDDSEPLSLNLLLTYIDTTVIGAIDIDGKTKIYDVPNEDASNESSSATILGKLPEDDLGKFQKVCEIAHSLHKRELAQRFKTTGSEQSNISTPPQRPQRLKSLTDQLAKMVQKL